ncbi:MAG: OmpA family protein [Planctomycetota bacterium]
MQFRSAPLLLALAVLPLVSACVSQRRYDESLTEAQFYQRNFQDLEAYQAQLEAELARLRAETEGITPVEATFTADIDERLAELALLSQRIGALPSDLEVAPVEGGFMMRVSDGLLFDSGQATVRSEGREILLKAAQEIAAHPHRRIWVRGHTDSDPVKKAETLARFPLGNLDLSVQRAMHVAELLANEGGLDRHKLVVAGFGPNQPIAPNDSSLNKARNRRVEIFVLDHDAAVESDAADAPMTIGKPVVPQTNGSGERAPDSDG